MFVGRARGASASRCRDRPGVRLLVGLRGLDAASQSSAGSTTNTEGWLSRGPSFVGRARGASASRCRDRPGVRLLSACAVSTRPRCARPARPPTRVSSTTNTEGWAADQCSLVEPGERQRAGVETALGCGWLSACLVSTRPRRARPARPPTRARSSIGSLVVGRGRGASASRCRDRRGAACRLGRSRRGLAALGRLDHRTGVPARPPNRRSARPPNTWMARPPNKGPARPPAGPARPGPSFVRRDPVRHRPRCLESAGPGDHGTPPACRSASS